MRLSPPQKKVGKTIDFSTRFFKHFRQAPPNVQAAFRKRFNIWLVDPHHISLHDHGLSGHYRGCRSLNVTGDWRAIYSKKKTGIIFLDIGTHSHLYR